MKTLLLALLGAIVIGSAHAESYVITLSAIATKQVPQTHLQLPPEFNNGPVEFQARFKVDESSAIEYGDFNCAPGTSTKCGAYGYTVSDLQVFLNGSQQEGWAAGVNENSFSYGYFDLKDRGFFTSGGLQSINNAWLPILSTAYPDAAFNFGEMYISTGGVAFTSFAFSATDVNGNKANGWAYSATSLVSSVPEPSTGALALAGLILIVRARRTVRVA